MENYTLKAGCIYKFEAWGGMGSKGSWAGSGGNGSHAVGWYDMRSSATVVASIFAGGKAVTPTTSTGGAPGWSATQLNPLLQGTKGGNGTYSGGGGGGASGIYVGTTALLVAGGGGGGAGTGGYPYGAGGDSWGGNGGRAGDSGSMGYGANNTYAGHGPGGSGCTAGSDSGGGNGTSAGGGAGGGWTRGFAGGGGTYSHGYASGGGGSGGISYVGGVQSLKNSAKSTTWTHSGANGNGKLIITEFVMAYSVETPADGQGYTVSAPSETLVQPGGFYTFTITRENGIGDIGLNLNTTNGSLELTSTNGSIFTYTVSNVQGQINASDFSVTTYNVEAPPDNIGAGYTISNQSSTSVLKGGSYSFIINLQNGYAMPRVTFSGNGKHSYSSVDIYGNLTVTISNVQGAITTANFSVTVSKI